MKKLILAIAASACAMSAYAANPEPIDLKVQLAGEVPPQGVFEVTPVGWASGEEAKIDIPQEWGGTVRYREFPFQVKSSYGAIHMTLSATSGGESMAAGSWRFQGEDGISKIGVKRRLVAAGGTSEKWVDQAKMEVASKEIAANGGEMKLRLGVYFDDTIPVKRGIAYTGLVSVVFETDIDG
ncbi:hypothetical protein GJG85_34775 [Burkholderia sp. MS389]|uniref:hypothetical protein n=1 Tax=Burkholderia TaxID=32008 RepID=UPI00076C1124|nr:MULTISPECIES: hypothetical protein [Burkholderia]KWU25566.1 hypothetical protein AS149_29650 [Burkholderia cenocepacia]QRR18538.1 hypothetical protein GJG85_34775 [Burkholderia sp. MS389]